MTALQTPVPPPAKSMVSDPNTWDPKPQVILKFITPEQAGEWLAQYNTKNRAFNEKRADRLAGDITRGVFAFTHQGISMDEHGILLDGQHRLRAIEISGIGLWMWVFLNMPRSSMGYIDNGAGRSIPDLLKFGHGIEANHAMVATLKTMIVSGGKKWVLTTDEWLGYYRKYQKSIVFSHSLFTGSNRGVNQSAVRAVIARTHHATVDPATLRRFAEILHGAPPRSVSENAAQSLRDYLNITTGETRKERTNKYQCVEYCLSSFLLGEQVQKVKEEPRELWPLRSDGDHSRKGRI